MAIIVEGKCHLSQEEETIPHITLDIVSSFINQIHSSRRVAREFSNMKLNEKYLEYPVEAYGHQGKYYWRNDYQESISEINYRGCNPSLIMPFYVEKKDGKYLLKCSEYPQANSLETISSWLNVIIIKEYLYSTGMSLKGEFNFFDTETERSIEYKINKEGHTFKKDNKEYIRCRESFINLLEEKKFIAIGIHQLFLNIFQKIYKKEN